LGDAALPGNSPACYSVCFSIAVVQEYKAGGSESIDKAADALINIGGDAEMWGTQAAGYVMKQFNTMTKIYNAIDQRENIKNMCKNTCNKSKNW